jgi:putative membrane protein
MTTNIMNTNLKPGKIILGIAIFLLILGGSSCKQEPKTEDTKEVAEDANEENLAGKDSIGDARADDSEYLVAAAETDMMEIELGKLALTKTSNAKVKDLANMMIDQHTKASEKLKPLAASKQTVLPAALTDKGKEHYDDLNKKSGKEFDEAYADLMVDGHEDAISKIKDASENAKDADVKKWAADMLPTLYQHLDHSKMLKDQINKTK